MNVMPRERATVTPERTLPDGSRSRKTNYFGVSGTPTEGPQAFLVEFSPAEGSVVKPHFHHVRQFQVFVRGDDARVGKRPVPPLSFHYTDPDTPYGPIVPGPEGVAFMTLRPVASLGTYYMPGSRDSMKKNAGRNIAVSVADGSEAPLIEPSADGLGAYALRIAPGQEVVAPDPAGSGGQYQLVWEGSLRQDDEELSPMSLIWVDPGDEPVTLRAGDEGALVLVLQYPVADPVEDAALSEERLARR